MFRRLFFAGWFCDRLENQVPQNIKKTKAQSGYPSNRSLAEVCDELLDNQKS